MGILIVDPRLMPSLPADAFPSRITRVIRTLVTKPNGQRDEIYTPDVDPLYVNVPCRKTPFIMQRPSDAERTTPEGEVTISEFICMLDRYLPEFRDEDRVVIDGDTYEVTAVESDGSNAYTRLKVYRIWQ